MSDLTAEGRAALRRLCEAASPGPWRACWYGPDEPAMLERVRIEAPDDEGSLIADFFTAGSEAPKQGDNAEFVAAARTALPALLDALDAAEAERKWKPTALTIHEPTEAEEAAVAAAAKHLEKGGAADQFVMLRIESTALRAEVSTLEAYRDRLEALLSDIVGEMGGSLPAPIPPEYVREVAFDAIHKIEDERAALRAEVERLRGRLERATAFAVVRGTARMCGSDEIRVEERAQRDDSIKWAVYSGPGSQRVLNRDSEWECEPMPSSRDEAFLTRCRFVTLEEAWSAAEAAQAKIDADEREERDEREEGRAPMSDTIRPDAKQDQTRAEQAAPAPTAAQGLAEAAERLLDSEDMGAYEYRGDCPKCRKRATPVTFRTEAAVYEALGLPHEEDGDLAGAARKVAAALASATARVAALEGLKGPAQAWGHVCSATSDLENGEWSGLAAMHNALEYNRPNGCVIVANELASALYKALRLADLSAPAPSRPESGAALSASAPSEGEGSGTGTRESEPITAVCGKCGTSCEKCEEAALDAIIVEAMKADKPEPVTTRRRRPLTITDQPAPQGSDLAASEAGATQDWHDLTTRPVSERARLIFEGAVRLAAAEPCADDVTALWFIEDTRRASRYVEASAALLAAAERAAGERGATGKEVGR